MRVPGASTITPNSNTVVYQVSFAMPGATEANTYVMLQLSDDPACHLLMVASSPSSIGDDDPHPWTLVANEIPTTFFRKVKLPPLHIDSITVTVQHGVVQVISEIFPDVHAVECNACSRERYKFVFPVKNDSIDGAVVRKKDQFDDLHNNACDDLVIVGSDGSLII